MRRYNRKNYTPIQNPMMTQDVHYEKLLIIILKSLEVNQVLQKVIFHLFLKDL
jgi:hypothetical protein